MICGGRFLGRQHGEQRAAGHAELQEQVPTKHRAERKPAGTRQNTRAHAPLPCA